MKFGSRAISVVAVLVFLVAAAITTFAQTQPASTRKVEPAARAEAPAPSVSPISTLLPNLDKFQTPRPVPRFPHRPATQRGQSTARTLKSLNGSTIVLSALSNACFPTTGGGTVVTDDTVLEPTCNLTWTASNLTNGYTTGGAASNYTDYMQAPNATAPTQVGTAGYTGTTGTGHAVTGMTSGTYVFGTYDNVNNAWIAILWVQVGNIAVIDTYSDNQYTTPIESSPIGSSIYIEGTGLTPQHNYVLSINNSSATGQCVYIAPNTSGTTSLSNGTKGLCNVATSNATGTYAPSNTIAFTWTPPNGSVTGYQGTAPTMVPGTYAVSLYDQTANQAVAQRQIAITSTGTTQTIPSIEFFSGPGTAGTASPGSANLPARIAWNGGSGVPHYDSNETYMDIGIGAINLPTTPGTPKFTFTLTDPNGKVYYSAQESNGANNVSPTGQQTALPKTTLDFAGEFPTSTWTAGIYQEGSTTTGATPSPLAVRGVKILSYAGEADFVTTSGGTESTVILPILPSGVGYAAKEEFKNTGDVVVGANNADPIIAFKSQFPATSFYIVRFYDANGSDAYCSPNPTTPCTQTFYRDRTSGAETGPIEDSQGHPWTATVSCTDPNNAIAVCGETSTFTLTMTPNSTSQPLQPGQYVIGPDLFFEEYQGSNPCPSSCAVENAVYPLDGFGYSGLTGSSVINNLAFQFNTTGNALAYGFMYFFGTATAVGTSPTIVQGPLPSGYTPRTAATAAPSPGFTYGPQAVLVNNQPFTATGKQVYALQVLDDNAGTNDYIQSLSAQFPAGFDATSASVYHKVAGVYKQEVVYAPGANGCPSGTYVCWTGNGNNNLLASSTSGSYSATPNFTSSFPNFDTYYIAINPPTSSFSYTDVAVSVIQGAQGTQPIRNTNQSIPTFVGTPSTVDAITIGTYSLNSAEILGSLNPTTLGAGITTSLTYSLQNTTTATDPFPDYIDAYVIELPNSTGSTSIASNGIPTSCSSGITVNTAQWSCIAVTANSPSGYNTYWFAPTGCSELYNSTLPPAQAGGVAGGSLPANPSSACVSLLQSYALQPGGQNSVSFNVTTSSTTGTGIPVYMFAHGANTNAWSNPVTSSLAVQNTAQGAAGFSNAGPYTTGVPAGVSSGSQPTVTSDTSTNGDSYIYSVKNVGSIGINKVVVTVPKTDSSGNTNGNYWTITTAGGAPSVSGVTGCSLAYASATAAGNGNLTVTGCTIPTNGTLQIRFNAKSPGAVGSTYDWPAALTDTGGNTTAAQETWFDDTTIAIALSASLSINVNAVTCTFGTGDGAGNTINTGTNTIDFGLLANSTTDTCLGVVTVNVYTNASSPVGWNLYAQIQNNVPTTGGPLADELGIKLSATSGSTNPAVSGGYFTYGSQTTYNVASGSGSAGMLMASSNGTGPAAAQTAPYPITADLQLGAGTETIPYTTAGIVFTWISN